MMIAIMLVVAVAVALISTDAYEDGKRAEAWFWLFVGILLEVMTYFMFTGL